MGLGSLKTKSGGVFREGGCVGGDDFVFRGPKPFFLKKCHESDITWLSHVVQMGAK